MRDLPPLIDGTLLNGRILHPKYAPIIRALRRSCVRLISSNPNDVEDAWNDLNAALQEFVRSSGQPKQAEYIARYGLTFGMRYPPRHPAADDGDLFVVAQNAGLPKLDECIGRFSRIGCLTLIGLNEARAGRLNGFQGVHRLISTAISGARRKDFERGTKVLQGARKGHVSTWGSEEVKKGKADSLMQMFERVEQENPRITSRRRLCEISSERLKKSGMQAVSYKTVERVVKARRGLVGGRD